MFIRFCTTLLIILLIAGSALAQEEESESSSSWDNEVKLSFVKTTGNTETSAFAGQYQTEATYDKSDFYAGTYFSYIETGGVESTNKLKIDGRYEYNFNKKVFALIHGDYIRDKFSGYEYRWSIGPGVGYNYWDNDKRVLKFFVSVLHRQNNFHDPDLDSQNNSALSTNNVFAYKLSKTVEVGNRFEYRTNLEEMSDYQLNNEISMAVKLNGNLSLGVSYRVDYQNEPPKASFEKTDTTFLTSLVIDF